MKILVVDDSKTFRNVIRQELQRGDFEIVEASDAFEAKKLILDHEFDLVTLDIDMPKMNGFEFCEQIRSEEFAKNLKTERDLLPIVFVTANKEIDSRIKGFKTGAIEYVSKDFLPGELLDTVTHILKPRNLLEGMTALVVDDSKFVRQVVAKFLADHGIHILEAGNGQEGIDILKEHITEVDMIISDLEMPVMRGDRFCQMVRKELGLKEVPVVFLTANPDREVLLDLFKSGATDYLVKPFLKEELLARLKVNLKMRMAYDRQIQERKKVHKQLQKKKQEKQEEAKLKESSEKDVGKVKMARIMLHNVNNLVNSLLVSCEHMSNMLKDSKLPQLLMGHKLLKENIDDASTFFREHPKGKMLPSFFEQIGSSLHHDHEALVTEINEITKKILLMRDSLDKHQAQDKKQDLYERIDLEEMVRESVHLLSDLIKQHGIEVREAFSDNHSVLAPRSKLLHVFINLIKNAIEAMSQVETKQLTLTSAMTDGSIVLKIGDTGVGIHSDNLKMMFQHGFTTKKDGHGYGLDFCAKVLSELGGSISVASPGAGKGATFTLKFPMGKENLPER